MNVLSLFDGMSCGRIALERAGIPVTNYFASEIEPNAIKVSKANYPDIIQLGDVTKISLNSYYNDTVIHYGDIGDYVFEGKIDLIIAGSPCQGFSFAGKQLNFEDPRSKLFFEFVRILNSKVLENHNPFFLLENVNMKKEYQNVISEQLGVEPIVINSSLVSAQNRVRLYWTNIPNIKQPADLNIDFSEISSDDYIYPAAMRGRRLSDEGKRNDYSVIPIRQYIEPRSNFKTNCLTTVDKDNVLLKQPISKRQLVNGTDYRFLNRREAALLQNIPLNYTNVVSSNISKKLCGLGWNVNTITHIFKNIPCPTPNTVNYSAC